LQLHGQDSTLYFDYDRAVLTAESKAKLQILLDDLPLEVSAYSVQLTGHADSCGSSDYNDKLVQRRLSSVQSYLIGKGIKKSAVQCHGHGETKPVSGNYSDDGCQANRRVEVKIEIDKTHDWKLPIQKFAVQGNRRFTIRTKNGCELTVDSASFVNLTGQDAFGELEVQLVEYNDAADYIASGIPMSYVKNGSLFTYHSHQMFQIKAFENGMQVKLKPYRYITVNCDFVDTAYQIGFYRFQAEHQEWFELERPAITDVQKEEQRVLEKEQEQEAEAAESVKEPEVAAEGETPKATTEENQEESNGDKARKRRRGSWWIRNRKKRQRKSPVDDMDETAIDSTARSASSFMDVLWQTRFQIIIDSTGRSVYCKFLCENVEEYINEGIETALAELDYYYDTSQCVSFRRRLLSADYIGLKEATNRSRADSSYLVLQHNRFGNRVRLKDAKAHNDLIQAVEIRFKYARNAEVKRRIKEEKFTYAFPILNDTSDRIELIFQSETAPLVVSATLKRRRPLNRATIEALNRNRLAFDYRVSSDCGDEATEKLTKYVCLYSATSALFPATRYQPYPEWLRYFKRNQAKMLANYQSITNAIDSMEWEACKTVIDSIGCKTRLSSGNEPILLLGLGIYNYDEVIPLTGLTTINTDSLVSEKGKVIIIKAAYLVLEGIDGMVNCTNKVVYVEGYNNTLLLEATDGRRYVAKLTDNGLKLVMKDVTRKTATLQGLKEVLGFPAD
jgi:hypothetical protein